MWIWCLAFFISRRRDSNFSFPSVKISTWLSWVIKASSDSRKKWISARPVSVVFSDGIRECLFQRLFCSLANLVICSCCSFFILKICSLEIFLPAKRYKVKPIIGSNVKTNNQAHVVAISRFSRKTVQIAAIKLAKKIIAIIHNGWVIKIMIALTPF